MSAPAASPTLPPPLPDVVFFDYTGGELLSIMFSMALWGVTCMQTFLYFFNTPKDSIGIRFLVVWLWVFDTVHQVLLVVGMYKGIHTMIPLVNFFAVEFEYILSVFFTTLVSVAAQGFFSYRIWIFSKKHWLAAVIFVPLVVFLFIIGTLFFVIDLKAASGTTIVNGKTTQAIAATYLSVTAIADVFIAISLSAFLWKKYLSIGMRVDQTKGIIARLMLFSVNSGFWPALFAVIAFIMLLLYPGEWLYVSFYFILSPIYCNTVLGSINARAFIRDGGKHIPAVTLGSSTANTFPLSRYGAGDNTTLQGSTVKSELDMKHVRVDQETYSTV